MKFYSIRNRIKNNWRILGQLLPWFRLYIHLKQIRKSDIQQLSQVRDHYSDLFITQQQPLVTVTIATYNRAQILTEIAIPSILNQTYPNIEVIVVGDGCEDETEQRLIALKEPRIHFYNFPQRGNYPKKDKHKWMVAGTPAINKALELANGLWIAHLDDDESFYPDHISTLLDHAMRSDYEMVHSKTLRQIFQDKWYEAGTFDFGMDRGSIPHSSVFFRSYLRLFKFDITAWRFGVGVDRYIWLRMKSAGVRMGFLNRVTGIASLRPMTTKPGYKAEDYT
jgi:glycosyltransferase involved in cell wall biosynthesis